MGTKHLASAVGTAALAASLLATAPATAREWAPSTTIKAPGAAAARFAINDSGRAVGVWSYGRYNGPQEFHAIIGNGYGRRWRHVPLGITEPVSSQPRANVAPDGSALITWSVTVPSSDPARQGSSQNLRAAWLRPGQALSTPQTVSVGGSGALVGMDGQGRAVASFSQRPSVGVALASAQTDNIGGPFGSPTVYVSGLHTGGGAALGVEQSGRAISAFSHWLGSHSRLSGAIREPGGQFGAPFQISLPGGHRAEGVRIASGSSQTTIAWNQGVLGKGYYFAGTTMREGRLDPPRRITPRVGYTGHDLSGTPDGGAALLYFRGLRSSEQRIELIFRKPAGWFGRPVPVTARRREENYSGMAKLPGQRAVVLWRESPIQNQDVLASVGGPTGFSRPVRLSRISELYRGVPRPRPGSIAEPQVLADRHGNAYAAWQRYDGGVQLTSRRAR